MITLDTHDSWQLMCKHDWPMRVVDGSDERTGCEADIATAVTRLLYPKIPQILVLLH